MRHSPISRFRGTLLGAFLGEIATGDIQSQSGLDLGRMAVLGTESLITLGKLDLDDWIARQQQESLHLATTDDISIKIILATLPVALFCHENPIKLQKNLLHILKIWEDDPVVRDGTLAVGYAISLALTEKLNSLTLIPQIISFLGQTPTSSIPQKLLRVQNLLEQGAGLSRAQAEFAKEEKLSNTIAMAFYCFLSTLEDFRLAVLQATHNGNFKVQDATPLSSQATGAITGALSGAYNGIGSIPVNWQLLLQRNSPTWGLTSSSQMLELTDALVAVWSGVYDIALNPRELVAQEGCEVALLSVYAAPRVIRSR